MSANGTASSGKVIPPAKLAHVVLTTAPAQMERMKKFYLNFLGGNLVYQNDYLCFITYDDEHHRIALAAFPGTKPKDHNASGLAHVAFTFNNLQDLCTSYKQRKALGMEPGWCVNHGPTTSMYYTDPDGNQLEAQVDNFDEPEMATAFMAGPDYAENALGADFDPEELCAAVDRGEAEEKLKVYKGVGPRGLEDATLIFEKMRNAKTGV